MIDQLIRIVNIAESGVFCLYCYRLCYWPISEFSDDAGLAFDRQMVPVYRFDIPISALGAAQFIGRARKSGHVSAYKLRKLFSSSKKYGILGEQPLSPDVLARVTGSAGELVKHHLGKFESLGKHSKRSVFDVASEFGKDVDLLAKGRFGMSPSDYRAISKAASVRKSPIPDFFHKMRRYQRFAKIAEKHGGKFLGKQSSELYSPEEIEKLVSRHRELMKQYRRDMLARRKAQELLARGGLISATSRSKASHGPYYATDLGIIPKSESFGSRVKKALPWGAAAAGVSIAGYSLGKAISNKDELTGNNYHRPRRRKYIAPYASDSYLDYASSPDAYYSY